MVCEFMLIPVRDGAESLDAPLDLLPLPNGTWNGKIAYLDSMICLAEGIYGKSISGIEVKFGATVEI